MAIVNLRLRTWIPQAEVHFLTDQYYHYYFKGDNRNSPMWSTLAYRTSQSFEIDTSTPNYTVRPSKNIQPTYSIIYNHFMNRLSTINEGTASDSGITYKKRVGSDDALYLDVRLNAANPGVPKAPPIDYKFTLKLTRTGSVRITGMHDGFPAYEFWRKIDGKSKGPELIYSYDPRVTGKTVFSLAGEMDISVNKGLPYTS